jgi:hypothetical protein
LSSGFLLVETVPGREAHVLDLLSRVPGVVHRHVIFPSAIAVKLDTHRDAFDLTASQLRALEGVTGTRVYRARNA